MALHLVLTIQPPDFLAIQFELGKYCSQESLVIKAFGADPHVFVMHPI